ncbi:hypothetical protein A8U91_01338 [Halomonas elongata]|uniref:Uncharacterized protein n=1 Tax=Halomonas elongata TaxID=2746 RepID=A0A1B8P437_HALEL|nr:hypothetical protein A8U91_01338 [Halomonas elongata]
MSFGRERLTGIQPIQTEAEYDAKVEALDELLDIVGDDEDHPLAGLVTRLGDIIEAYDEERRPMPEALLSRPGKPSP